MSSAEADVEPTPAAMVAKKKKKNPNPQKKKKKKNVVASAEAASAPAAARRALPEARDASGKLRSAAALCKGSAVAACAVRTVGHLVHELSHIPRGREHAGGERRDEDASRD